MYYWFSVLLVVLVVVCNVYATAIFCYISGATPPLQQALVESPVSWGLSGNGGSVVSAAVLPPTSPYPSPYLSGLHPVCCHLNSVQLYDAHSARSTTPLAGTLQCA